MKKYIQYIRDIYIYISSHTFAHTNDLILSQPIQRVIKSNSGSIFFIILFITFTRIIFLLKHTLFSHNKILKLILIFAPIPLFFYSIDALFNFQDFIDRGGHIEMLNHLNPDTAMDISRYIKYQFVFFGTGAIIVIILFPIRMIISIWRGINKGTV